MGFELNEVDPQDGYEAVDGDAIMVEGVDDEERIEGDQADDDTGEFQEHDWNR